MQSRRVRPQKSASKLLRVPLSGGSAVMRALRLSRCSSVSDAPKHRLEGVTHVFEARHGVPPRQPNRVLELHCLMGAIVRTR
jgi:hypothetical protein